MPFSTLVQTLQNTTAHGITQTKAVFMIVGLLITIYVIAFIAISLLRARRGSSIGVSGALAKAEYVGVVIDIDTNEVKLVPLQTVDMNTLATPPNYKGGAMHVFKLPKAKPIRFANKPAYIIVSKGIVGYTMPEDMLVKTGIASIVIDSTKWDSDNPSAMADLIADLLSKGREATGSATISENTKIGFTLKIAPIIQSLVSLLGGMGISNVKGMEDKLLESKKISERMKAPEIGPNVTKVLMFVGGALFILGIIYLLVKAGVFGGITHGIQQTKHIIPQATKTIIQNMTKGG